MYLHLGRDIGVSDKTILGIFDLDTSTVSKHTKAFLSEAEKNKNIVVVSEDLPKSAVVCIEKDETVIYLSQISTQTLVKRSNVKPLFESII